MHKIIIAVQSQGITEEQARALINAREAMEERGMVNTAIEEYWNRDFHKAFITELLRDIDMDELLCKRQDETHYKDLFMGDFSINPDQCQPWQKLNRNPNKIRADPYIEKKT